MAVAPAVADAFLIEGSRRLSGTIHVAGNKNGQLDPRMLGRWLEAHLNRISAGHKLLVDRETNKARPRWSVAPR